jgi:hypothetical protein
MKVGKLFLLLFILICIGTDQTFAQNNIPGIIAHYNLNGNALEAVSDSLRGKATGIKKASDRFNNNEGAVSFSNINNSVYGYISIPVDLSANKYPVTTICFWIKANETYQKIAPFRTGDEKSRGILTDYNNGAQRWSASAGKDGLIGGPAVLKDQWTFIAVIYDAPNEQVRLIVNNEVFGGRARLKNSNTSITIGSFNGSMDDLQIFNRALSLKEIESVSGSPVTVNLKAFAIEDRSEYKKQIEEKRKSKVRPGDRFIVGFDELIIRDSINSPNTLFVYKEGDTLSVLNAFNDEWFGVKNQRGQEGLIRGKSIEKNCYKIGSSKTIFRLLNWLGQIFQFNRFRNWLVVALFTVILILAIRNRTKLNKWFQRIGSRDPREAGGSKSEGTRQPVSFPKFEKYFPIERPKWWMISPGVVFGFMLVLASIWDGNEMEWYFNEGASVIPHGFTLPIHWVLWSGTIVVILLVVTLVIESLIIAGPWIGLLRSSMLLVLNLLAVVVAFYLTAGVLIAIIGFILFFIVAMALISRRR